MVRVYTQPVSGRSGKPRSRSAARGRGDAERDVNVTNVAARFPSPEARQPRGTQTQTTALQLIANIPVAQGRPRADSQARSCKAP